jgi:hypothetical protein
MIQYIIAAGIGAFLGSRSKKSKKSYAHGGSVKVGKKYGDWSVTQYKPLSYDDLGSQNDGYLKLVNQDTFDEIIIDNDNALKGSKWFTNSVKGIGISDKKLSVVIDKSIASFKSTYAEGGGVGKEYSPSEISTFIRFLNNTTTERIKKDDYYLYKHPSVKGRWLTVGELLEMWKGKTYMEKGGSTYAEGGLVGERIIFVETDMQFVGETATVLDRKKGVLTVKLDDNGTRNDGKIVYVDVPIAFWEGQVEVLLQKNNREELLKYLMYKYDEDEAKIKRFIKYYENAHDKPYPSNNYMIKHIKSQLNDENFKPFTWEGKEQSVVGYTLPYNDYAKGGKTRKKRKN